MVLVVFIAFIKMYEMIKTIYIISIYIFMVAEFIYFKWKSLYE